MTLDPETTGPETVSIAGETIAPGSRVRLCPRGFGDIYDIALAGRVAVVEGLDRDREDNLHVAVLLEDDPGRAVGSLRQHGHRFFFALEEIIPLEDA